MTDINEYTRKYNNFLKERKDILSALGDEPQKASPEQLEQVKNKLLDSAERHGLKVDRTSGGRIYTPENIQTGSICRPWEREYKVPFGNWLYDKDNTCGKGCLCVDKGADKTSLDKLNLLKSIELQQVCDGSKEHKPRTNYTPYVAFEYISESPMDIPKLKSLCSSAKRIVVNDYSSQDIRNLCTNDIQTKEETKASRKRAKEFYKGQRDMFGTPIVTGKHPSVLIFGKRYNDKRFWVETANVISGLEKKNHNHNKTSQRKNNPLQKRTSQSSKLNSIFKSSLNFGNTNTKYNKSRLKL